MFQVRFHGRGGQGVVTAAELNRILDMGVTLELNTRVTDILDELNEAADGHAGAGGGFDAAFVAVGAYIGKRAYIPAGDSARIMDAVSMLHSGFPQPTGEFKELEADCLVLALGQYEFDYDYCKGCGLCVAECPCGSIEMQPEQT